MTNLTVTNITDTSVSLSWSPPDGNTSSYLIQIQDDDKYNKTTTLTAFTIQDLTPGTLYTFLVSTLAGYDTVQGDSVSALNYTSKSLLHLDIVVYFIFCHLQTYIKAFFSIRIVTLSPLLSKSILCVPAVGFCSLSGVQGLSSSG